MIICWKDYAGPRPLDFPEACYDACFRALGCKKAR